MNHATAPSHWYPLMLLLACGDGCSRGGDASGGGGSVGCGSRRTLVPRTLAAAVAAAFAAERIVGLRRHRCGAGMVDGRGQDLSLDGFGVQGYSSIFKQYDEQP